MAKSLSFKSRQKPKELYLKIGNSRLTYWKGSGIAASVVPRLNKKFSGMKFVGTKNIPLKLPYKKGIGIDRVVNVFSATRLFPGKSFLIVDFGSATTFEFFHSRKGYLGGWIAPGTAMMLKALQQNTALLPHTHLSDVGIKMKTGKNSKDSIRLGVQHSLMGAVMIALQSAPQILGSRNFLLIVTGGGAKPFLKSFKRLASIKLPQVHHEPLLLLRGLKALHHDKLI